MSARAAIARLLRALQAPPAAAAGGGCSISTAWQHHHLLLPSAAAAAAQELAFPAHRCASSIADGSVPKPFREQQRRFLPGGDAPAQHAPGRWQAPSRSRAPHFFHRELLAGSSGTGTTPAHAATLLQQQHQHQASFATDHGIHPSQEPGPQQQQQQQQQQAPVYVPNHSASSEALLGPELALYDPPSVNSGGSRQRCRRKTPVFQVIEFYASGGAAESFSPRTPQELGLHPRDVTLFAPLSRLAAPQRATIAVHDGKILLKTEIVKAVITADKVTLIKGRRQRDTQKLAQAILAANDQRLKAIRLAQHQAEQLTSSIIPGGSSGLGSCERAASAADLLRKASEKHSTRSGSSGSGGSSGGGGHPGLRAVVTTPGGGLPQHPFQHQHQHQHGGPAAAGGAGGQSPAPGYVATGPSGGSSGSSSHGFSSSSWGGFAAAGAAADGGDGGFGGTLPLQPAAVASGQVLLAQAGGGGSGEAADVPFEMLVLEVLLDATADYFYTKVQHLNWMLESIAADIRQGGKGSPAGGIDKAHQLLPIQKFMTSLKNDVHETCDAIKTALADDEMLQELCLSWHLQQRQHSAWMPVELQRHRAARMEQQRQQQMQQQQGNGNGGWPGNGGGNGGNGNGRQGGGVAPGAAPQVRLLTEMLESYEREIESLEGSVKEAEEDLENTRSIWHMQLDSSRNHIIMVNLWLSMINISVMATTILPAFFGMNLTSGLSENDPTFFYAVCGGSVLLSALSYPLSRFWFIRNWRRANQTKLFEQKMLRVLLVQNIEDVDDIIAALSSARHRHLDKRAFRELMHGTLGSRAITPTSIDFMWELFDRDRDGFLAEAEHMRPINTYTNSSSSDAATSSTSSSTVHHPQHTSAILPQPGSSSSSSGGGWPVFGGGASTSGQQPSAPAEYQQQAAMAGILPAALGSLGGRHPLQQQQQQQAGAAPGATAAAAAAAAAAGAGLSVQQIAQLQAQHAVRVTPSPGGQAQQQAQQQQQQQPSEQQQQSQPSGSRSDDDDKEDPPGGWLDDERYSWD